MPLARTPSGLPAFGTDIEAINAAQPAASVVRTNPDTALDAKVLAALNGARPSTAGVVAGRGGMGCSPAAIQSLAPDLTFNLPADAATHTHRLIVVTPERGWVSIYSSDDGAAGDGEDVIQPSDVITWPLARDRARFTLRAEELDGLGPRDDTPAAVFLEAGRYLFALVTDTDAELMALDGRRTRVLATCAFDWTPEFG